MILTYFAPAYLLVGLVMAVRGVNKHRDLWIMFDPDLRLLTFLAILWLGPAMEAYKWLVAMPLRWLKNRANQLKQGATPRVKLPDTVEDEFVPHCQTCGDTGFYLPIGGTAEVECWCVAQNDQ